MKFSQEDYDTINNLISDELNNLKHGEDDVRKEALESALNALDTIGTY